MPAIAPLASPPQSQEQLLAQAPPAGRLFAGRAGGAGGDPHSGAIWKRDKGWTGILLELWLGASAGSKPRAGFRRAGGRAQNDPHRQPGTPAETTFVCARPVNRQ